MQFAGTQGKPFPIIRTGIVQRMEGVKAVVIDEAGYVYRRHALSLFFNREEAEADQERKTAELAALSDEDKKRCRKAAYPDKRAAITVANSMRQKNGVKLRAYSCSICGNQWHLTHRVREELPSKERKWQ